MFLQWWFNYSGGLHHNRQPDNTAMHMSNASGHECNEASMQTPSDQHSSSPNHNPSRRQFPIPDASTTPGHLKVVIHARPQHQVLFVSISVERAQSGTIKRAASVTVEPLSTVPEACHTSVACYDHSERVLTRWPLCVGAPRGFENRLQPQQHVEKTNRQSFVLSM